MKKTIILILAIALPIGIIVFLHSFGENEYNIPFLEPGQEAFFYRDCDSFSNIDGKIKLNNPFCNIDSSANTRARIYVLNTPEMEDLRTGHWVEFKRVMQYFRDSSSVNFNMFTFFIDSSKMQNAKLLFEDWGGVNWSYPYTINSDSSYSFEMLLRCSMHWPHKKNAQNESSYKPDIFQAVLIDKDCTIRGNYDLEDRKELDRLIREIQILTTKNEG